MAVSLKHSSEPRAENNPDIIQDLRSQLAQCKEDFRDLRGKFLVSKATAYSLANQMQKNNYDSCKDIIKSVLGEKVSLEQEKTEDKPRQPQKLRERSTGTEDQEQQLTQLRRQVQGGRAVSVLLSQYFTDLLGHDDPDYYRGQGFRDQLVKGRRLAERLARELRPENQIDLEEEEGPDQICPRGLRLEESREYVEFMQNAEEEEAWISEMEAVVVRRDSGDTLASTQNLLKKYEALCKDFVVHRTRVQNLCAQGGDILSEVTSHQKAISTKIDALNEKIPSLAQAIAAWKLQLDNDHAFQQFNWKADVVEAWIGEKEASLKFDGSRSDLAAFLNLLAKQDTLDASLESFQQERLSEITDLKDQLVAAQHCRTEAIEGRYAALLQRFGQLLEASQAHRNTLLEKQNPLLKAEGLFAEFAHKASVFNHWCKNAQKDLSEPVHCDSLAKIWQLQKDHEAFLASLAEAQSYFSHLLQLDQEIKALNVPSSPYTWLTVEVLDRIWKHLHDIIKEREQELQKEGERQVRNFHMLQEFEQRGSHFLKWILETRAYFLDGSLLQETGSLESQLEGIKRKQEEIQAMLHQLTQLEDLGDRLEEALILDINHTIGLAQQWDQLYQLGMVMQHTLEQQIQARTGYVSQKDYTSFLIDEESENIRSTDEIESPFLAMEEVGAYITKEDMEQALTPEQVAFCALHMQQYVNPQGRSHPAGYNYVGFIDSEFVN